MIMDDNTFWFLIMLFCTPIGWIGLIFSGWFLFLTCMGIGALIQGIRGKLY